MPKKARCDDASSDSFVERRDSLSTTTTVLAAQPPSLQMRDHYRSSQPGAYHMSPTTMTRVLRISNQEDSSSSSSAAESTEEEDDDCDNNDNMLIEASLVVANCDENIDLEQSSNPLDAVVSPTQNPIVEAAPLDHLQLQLLLKNRKVQIGMGVLCILIASLIVGMVIGFVSNIGGQQQQDEQPKNSNIPRPPPPTCRIPTIREEFGDRTMEEFITNVLPYYTQQALQNASSPQSKALAWLQNDNTQLLFDQYSSFQRLQRFVLATLFYATDGETSWKNNNGWLEGDLHECEWEMVTCNNERAIRVLSLSGNGLRGTIPEEVYYALCLESLRFDKNIELVGTLSTRIGALTQLREFHAYENTLSGTIPTEIGNAAKLVELYMHYNVMNGSLPTELGRLEWLEHLWLGDNFLSGTLPSELSSCELLETLELSGNMLRGTIPLEYNTWKRLSMISLLLNQLTGTIPNVLLEQWNNVVDMDLGFNGDITGSIPTEIGFLSNIENLGLFWTSLHGTLPTELGLLSNAAFMYLDNNLLEGTIPSELGMLQENLRALWLFGNANITGSVPTEVCDLVENGDLSLVLDCDLVQCTCGCNCSETMVRR